VLRDSKAVIVGAALLLAACGAQPVAVRESPAAHVSPTIAASPTPTVPLAITSVAFHAGEIGFGYTPVTPSATGGVPPYSWSISDGSLPGGLVMSSSGGVTGTPNVLGTFLFTVQVGDSVSATASISSSITVARRIAVTGNPCTVASPCSVEAGCVTACGLFGFLSGGFGPFTYKVTKGSIPTGMALSGFSLTKAFPAPATAGGKDWVFTVRVTDAIGAFAETTAKFHVYPHVAFTGALTATCGNGTAETWQTGCIFKQPLTYVLGTPGLGAPKVQVSLVTGPTLPAGLTFTAKNGTVSAIAPLSPACNSKPFQATVHIVLVDTSTCAPNKYCASTAATVNINLLRC
jgi:hypothetical protein